MLGGDDDIMMAGKQSCLAVVDYQAVDFFKELFKSSNLFSIQRFIVSATTNCGLVNLFEKFLLEGGGGIGKENKFAVGKFLWHDRRLFGKDIELNAVGLGLVHLAMIRTLPAESL